MLAGTWRVSASRELVVVLRARGQKQDTVSGSIPMEATRRTLRYVLHALSASLSLSQNSTSSVFFGTRPTRARYV